MIKGAKHTEEAKRKVGKASQGRKHTEETKRKMSEAHKGKKFSEETKKKISEANISRYVRNPKLKTQISEKLGGEKLSDETRKKISEAKKGKHPSEETRIKLRKARFKYAKKMGGFTCPNIGRNEKQILDGLEQKLEYRIIRQYGVGGYYLDGYIPEINLVIEVDEIPKITERDIRREEFVKQKLGCRFLRIKDY